MAHVLRTLSYVFDEIELRTASGFSEMPFRTSWRSNDRPPTWQKLLNLIELYFAAGGNPTQSFVFRDFVDNVVLAGLALPVNKQSDNGLLNRNKLDEYLAARDRASGTLAHIVAATSRALRELHARSQQVQDALSAEGSRNFTQFEYYTMLLSNTVCGHRIVETTTTFDNTTDADNVENEDNILAGSTAALQQTSALQLALSETRLDSDVIKTILNVFNNKTTNSFLDSSLLKLETLLGAVLTNKSATSSAAAALANSEVSFSTIANTSRLCYSFEHEAKRTLKTNVLYSLIKPLIRGKLLYYYAESEDEHADMLDHVITTTNTLLASIRRSFSFTLQTLNLFTNIGHARRQFVTPRNSRILTRIAQKLFTSGGGSGGGDLDSISEKVVAFLSQKSIRDETLRLVHAVLDMQEQLYTNCVADENDAESYIERAASLGHFEQRSAQLDSANLLLGAVVFSPERVYNPEYAEYFRTDTHANKTLTYELLMNRKRMREFDRIEPKLHSTEAIMPPLHYLRYLLTFVPVQDALERAIILNAAAIDRKNDGDEQQGVIDSVISQLPAIYAQKMPIPCFIHDNALKLLVVFLPLLMIVGITLNAGLMSYDLASDRHHHLDRMLRLHGMLPGVRTAVWLVKWLIMWTFMTCIVVLYVYPTPIVGSALVELTDWTLFFVLLWTFFICNVAFVLLLTSAMRLIQAPALVTSAVVMGLLLILSTFPARWLGETELRQPQYLLNMFWLIHCANGFVLFVVVMIAEQGRSGLLWSNWNEVGQLYGATSPKQMYEMLVYATLLYTAAAVLLACVDQWWRRRRESWPTLEENDAVAPDADNDGVVLKNVSKTYSTKTCCSNVGILAKLNHFCRHFFSSSDPADSASGSKSSSTGAGGGVSQSRSSIAAAALDNVSAKFTCNELVCLLGLNGAGKSTLMSILCGFSAPTRGTVNMFGHGPLTARNIRASRKWVGYCPQHDVILKSTTVREHLQLFAQLRHGYQSSNDSTSAGGITKMINDILRQTELEQFADLYAERLSGGYKRRMMLAIAFACGTRLCVLDEPSSGVDPAARRLLWQLILQQRRKDRVIVISTHHVDEAEYLADRVAIVDCGRIVASDTPQALVQQNNNLVSFDWRIRVCVSFQVPQQLYSNDERDVVTYIVDLICKHFPSALLPGGGTMPSPSHRTRATDINLATNKWLTFHIAEPYSTQRKLMLITEILERKQSLGIVDVEILTPHLGQVFCSVIGQSGSDVKVAVAGDAADDNETDDDDDVDQHLMLRKKHQEQNGSINNSKRNLTILLPTFTDVDAKFPDSDKTKSPVVGPAADEEEYKITKPLALRAILFISQMRSSSLFLRQFLSVLWKRTVHDLRNPLLTCSIYGLSIALLVITALFLGSGHGELGSGSNSDAAAVSAAGTGGAVVDFSSFYDRPAVELAQVTHMNEDHIDLNPKNHYWAFPTFYAYNRDADNFINQVVDTLKNDTNLNHMDVNKCFRCPDAFEREQARIDEQLLQSTNDSTWRLSVDEPRCGKSETLTLPPSPATSFAVDAATGIKHLHVDLSYYDDIVRDYSEDAVYMRPRHTQIRKIFGGYSFRHNSEKNQDEKNIAIVWHSPHAEHSLPKFLSQLNSAMLKVVTHDPQWYLNAYASVLPEPVQRQNFISQNGTADDVTSEQQAGAGRSSISRLSSMAYVVLSLTFTFLPTFAAVHLINERQRGERRAQLLAGLSPLTYWLATLTYDLIIRQYVLFLPLAALVFAVLQSPVYTYDDGSYWCCMATICLFCFASTALVFCAAHAYSDAQLAFTTLGTSMVLFGFGAALVASPGDFLSMLDNDNGKRIQVQSDWVFLWLPHFALTQALMNVQQSKLRAEMLSDFICREVQQSDDDSGGGAASSATTTASDNEWQRSCAATFKENVWAWHITGRALVSLFLSGLGFMLLLIIMEWLVRPNWAAMLGTRQVVNQQQRRSVANNDKNATSSSLAISVDGVCYSYSWRDRFKSVFINLFCRRNKKPQNRTDPYREQTELLNQTNDTDAVNVVENGDADATKVVVRSRKRQQAAVAADAVVTSTANSSTKNAVHKISLQVRTGECYGLFGFNGAGKTTLFKCLTGQLTPQAGLVTLYTDDINDDDDADVYDDDGSLVRKRRGSSRRRRSQQQRPLIGYCPQTDPLEPYCTLYETLAYNCCIRNMPPLVRRRDVEQLQRRFRFAVDRQDDWHKRVLELSGGTRRKLSTAIAMLCRPRILLLDEPTTGVDVSARAVIGEAIREQRRGGAADSAEADCAIILTSHHMSDATSMCSRLAIVRHGRLVLEDQMRNIERTFSTRFLVLTVIFKQQQKSKDAEQINDQYGQLLLLQLKQKFCASAHQVQVRRRSSRLIEFVVENNNSNSDEQHQHYETVTCLSLSQFMLEFIATTVAAGSERQGDNIFCDDFYVQRSTIEEVFYLFSN